MEYLEDSVTILQISYENYRSNFHNGFEELQKINLKTGRDFSILDYYVGPLYSINADFSGYIEIESLNDKLLNEALIKFFDMRNQKLYDITLVKPTYYKITITKNNEEYEYYIRQESSSNMFIIERITKTPLD